MPLPITLDFHTCETIYLLILFTVTYSVKRSTFQEDNRLSASQKIYPHFMESGGSLPHWPVLIFGQINPVDASSNCFLETYLILSTHLRLGLPNDLFPSCFPTKTPYAPLLSSIRATCPVCLILLDLITRLIFAEGYRS